MSGLYPLTDFRATTTGMSSGVKHDHLSELIVVTMLFLGMLFQKVALSFGGGTLLPVNILLVIAVTVLGILTRRLVLDPMRSVCILAFFAAITISQMAGIGDFSVAGVGLLVCMHLPYLFRLRAQALRPGVELEYFQKLCMIISVLGISQFVLQFVVGWQYAFFIDRLDFGQSLVILKPPNMNNLNPLSYGSSIYKSNGVLMNEASVMSQFLALGVVIEVVYFRRMWALLLFLSGIAVTFSGTGLMMLLLVLPFYLFINRHFFVLSAMMLLMVTAPLWAQLVGLDVTLSRISEFTSPSSSGYARFVSPFRLTEDFVFKDMQTFAFGMGAGSIRDYTGPGKGLDYEAFDPSWIKLMFEYGMLGFLMYIPATFVMFLRNRKSGYLKAAILITYFVLGGYLASPYLHLLILPLLAWPADPLPKDYGKKAVVNA